MLALPKELTEQQVIDIVRTVLISGQSIVWDGQVIGQEALKPGSVRMGHVYIPDPPVNDYDPTNKEYVDNLTTNPVPGEHHLSHEDGGVDEILVTGLSGLLHDAQTPSAHKLNHQDAGSDEISIEGLSGTSAALTTHKGSSDHDSRYFTETECNANFAALAHKARHEDTGADEISVAGLSGLLADAQTPKAHNLIDLTGHPAAGLTAGHFLKATAATTYAFGAHGLTAGDVGAAPSAEGVTGGNSHDHVGGDGAQIDHGGLGGLADDDHTQYTQKATLTAKGDLYTASSAGVPIRVGIGADGSILRVGTDTPAWTTLTIPTTIAIHSILAANASNVLSAVTAGAATLTILEHSAAGVIAWVVPTGTGSPVYSTSPTLVTPILGTPTSGTLTNCDGTAASLTAGKATVLATTRAINGVNFDGSAAITVPVNNADDVATNATMYPLWTATAGGNYAAKVSTTKLYFNPSTGLLTATGFAGPLTGNVTGNCSGSSGSCSGNASTVTTNANLTGPITSVGNATSIASQTGTGTKFVVDTSPTIVTPTIASFLNANHTHAAAGATGGLVEHHSLNGLGDDDHTIYTKKSTLTEQGDLYYASAPSTPAALVHGITGQILISGGHGANPSWTGALDLTGDSSIAIDKKFLLEGAGSDSYLIYNSTTKKVELYVDGVLVNSWGNNGLKMLMDGTTAIKELITPPSTAFTMTGGVGGAWPGDSSNFRTLLGSSAPVIAQAVDNLLSDQDASLEGAGVGWWAGIGANVTRITTDSWHGSACLSVELTADGNKGAVLPVAFSNGTRTFSGRVKAGNAGAVGETFNLTAYGDVSGVDSSANITLTTSWQNVFVSHTFAGDGAASMYGLLQAGETGDIVLIDGCQNETGAVQTPFALDTRTACTMSIPTATIGLTAGMPFSVMIVHNGPWAGNDGVGHYLLTRRARELVMSFRSTSTPTTNSTSRSGTSLRLQRHSQL